jgi:hypothetical protein
LFCSRILAPRSFSCQGDNLGDHMRSPQFRNANFHYSVNCPLSILGAGIFEINQTPQQSVNIFRKNTSTRSQSSCHLQSTKRAKVTVAGLSNNTANAAPSSISISFSFYIINVGTGTPIITPQPAKPLTCSGGTSTMINRRGMRTLVYPSHPRMTYARQGRRGTKKSWASPSPLQAATWTSYSLHYPSSN